jgi:hypothetical protein
MLVPGTAFAVLAGTLAYSRASVRAFLISQRVAAFEVFAKNPGRLFLAGQRRSSNARSRPRLCKNIGGQFAAWHFRARRFGSA